jgi:hypothetical protein
MIERLAIGAFLALLLALAVFSDPPDPPPPPPTTVDRQHRGDNHGSGLGMKFDGRLGLELAPGIVMDFDGDIGPGFGF